MQNEVKWITKNGYHIPITNKYMNDKIRGKNTKQYISTEKLTFQSDDYGKYIEENDVGRIDIFKNILKNKKDDEYYGFKYKDISAPIIIRNEQRDGKYIIYDGQHRYIAYRQLGIKKVPIIFKN